MPAARAAFGLWKMASRPSISTVPASGRYTPARIFISVDLPAPFSPVIACTEPRRPVRETSSSARVEPKSLRDGSNRHKRRRPAVVRVEQDRLAHGQPGQSGQRWKQFLQLRLGQRRRQPIRVVQVRPVALVEVDLRDGRGRREIGSIDRLAFQQRDRGPHRRHAEPGRVDGRDAPDAAGFPGTQEAVVALAAHRHERLAAFLENVETSARHFSAGEPDAVNLAARQHQVLAELLALGIGPIAEGPRSLS